MRTLNSFKNITTNIGTVLILAVIGFVTRKIFLDTLGEEYLGLNGLLSSVIGMMGLIESGVGVSIVYNLYKPLADNDTPVIISLVQLYRKIYRTIALGFLFISILMYPFLGHFIEMDAPFASITIIYFIFVFNSCLGYLMADKYALINCDQKGYRLAGYYLGYQIFMYLVKICILVYLKNYILFLTVDLVCQLFYNLIIKWQVNRDYPYIKTTKRYQVPIEIKKNIIKNVKALFISSVGGFMLHSTDNLLISAYVSLSTVGLYSNYVLLVNQVKSLATPFLNGVKDSIGNLISSESREKQYEAFNMFYLVNFIVISFITIMLYAFLNPFIGWWLGEKYLFNKWIVGIICANLYVDMIRSSAFIFKTTSGIFVQDKYIPFLTGAINLIASIALVKFIGFAGILLGTMIAILTTNTWNWPRLIFKYTFQRSPMIYFKNYALYGALAFILCLGIDTLNSYLCSDIYNISNILLLCVLDSFLLLLTFFVLFRKTEAWHYAVQIVKVILNIRKTATT